MYCFFFTHFISLSICLYNIFYFSLVTLALVPVCLLSCVHLLSCFSLFPNWWLSLHAGCSSLLKMRFSVTVARCLVLGGSLRLGFYTLCVYTPLCIYLKKNVMVLKVFCFCFTQSLWKHFHASKNKNKNLWLKKKARKKRIYPTITAQNKRIAFRALALPLSVWVLSPAKLLTFRS